MATASVTNSFVDATLIDAGDFNTNFNDLVTFLNTHAVHKDGANAMTGDLAMGTNKITGLGTPTADTDAATKLYVDGLVGGGSHEHDGTDITSGLIPAARIPNLSADIITSGTFASARIPNLAASKITSGTIDYDRLPIGQTSTTVPSGNHAHSGSFVRTSGSDTIAGVKTFQSKPDFESGIDIPASPGPSGELDMYWGGVRRKNDAAYGSLRLDTSAGYQLYYHTSTKYVKENDETIPVERSREVINLLRPITYDAEGAERRQIGFFAEEVAAAEPLTAAVPKDTERGPGEVETYGWDGIIAHLVNLVADHEKRIAALEAACDCSSSGS